MEARSAPRLDWQSGWWSGTLTGWQSDCLSGTQSDWPLGRRSAGLLVWWSG